MSLSFELCIKYVKSEIVIQLLLSNYYNFLGKVSLLVNYVSFAAKILNIFKSLIENVSVKGEGIRGKVDVS